LEEIAVFKGGAEEIGRPAKPMDKLLNTDCE
jgi:hypothetical protein